MTTQWFEVRKVVRQGCILSPYLFNTYSEYVLRRLGFEDNIGVKVGGGNYKQLAIYGRHHNISEKYGRHGKTTKKLMEGSEKAGLVLNLKKTNIMTTGTLNESTLVGGKTINNWRYTDDTTILAKNTEDMEKLLKS